MRPMNADRSPIFFGCRISAHFGEAMRKITLMVLLAIVCSGAAAQKTSPPYWKPWNEVRVFAPDLVWKDVDLPKQVFDAIPGDSKYKADDGSIFSYFWRSASIDLDGDTKNELILRSSEFFSGGPVFLIMQKRGNLWRVIGQIQGGFTISKRTTNLFADIESWSRHPETYHHLWKFSVGKYKVARTETGPYNDRALELPYIP